MDPILLLTIGGLGLLVCLVLLFFGVNMLREERKAKAAAADPANAKAPTPAKTAAESPAPAASPAASPTPGTSALTGGMARLTAGVMARMPHAAAAGSAHEVMRVLRDNLTGRILIELGGQRYTHPSEVPDADLRQALQTILIDLKVFQSGAAGEPMAPIQMAAGAMYPPAPAESVDAARPPMAPVTPAAPRAAGHDARPLPKPTMNPFKQMAVLRELAANPPPPTMTITEQIDAVLQDHLRGTPLAERGIKMRQGPRGDAVFDLDGVGYTGVEELPDEAVRVVVRAAIAEWEGKQ